MERYFLQLPGYNILDTMGKGITLPELLASTERERERERASHLGVISLNYINTAPIVVVRQKATKAVENCSAWHRSLKSIVQKVWFSLFDNSFSINIFVKQKKGNKDENFKIIY